MTSSQTFAWLKKCPSPKLSQRLPPHPHPGTSAIIFTTGNSKVVNSFRGWYLSSEIVGARRFTKLQNGNCFSEPGGWRPRVWDHQSGEVCRCECEWQQQADPNLLSQYSQKKERKKRGKHVCENSVKPPPADAFLFLWNCKAISLEFLN